MLPLDTTRAADPFLLVIREAGVAELDGAKDELVAAVWQNGRIIRAATRDTLGTDYIEATLSDADLSELMSKIVETGLSTPLEYRIIVDFWSFKDEYFLRLRDQLISVHAFEPEKPKLGELGDYLMSLPLAPIVEFQGRVSIPLRWRLD